MDVGAYRLPTDATFAWTSTTIVVAEVSAGGERGLGYTYADRATAVFVKDLLTPIVVGSDIAAAGRTWAQLVAAIRNLGRSGIAAMAISAVDNARFDARARVHDAPLAELLGAERERVPVYGSGGFTSYARHPAACCRCAILSVTRWQSASSS